MRSSDFIFQPEIYIDQVQCRVVDTEELSNQ